MMRKQCWGFPFPSSHGGSPWRDVWEQRFCRLKIHDQVFKIAVAKHSTATCFVHLIHPGTKHTPCNSSLASCSHTEIKFFESNFWARKYTIRIIMFKETPWEVIYQTLASSFPKLYTTNSRQNTKFAFSSPAFVNGLLSTNMYYSPHHGAKKA